MAQVLWNDSSQRESERLEASVSKIDPAVLTMKAAVHRVTAQALREYSVARSNRPVIRRTHEDARRAQAEVDDLL